MLTARGKKMLDGMLKKGKNQLRTKPARPDPKNPVKNHPSGLRAFTRGFPAPK